MRLYLSSYYLGEKPELLHDIIPIGGKIAIIPNAADYRENIVERDAWVASQAKEFSTLGYEAINFDLIDYFNDYSQKLRHKLGDFDMVWLIGGNSFILRKAMAQSGFDKIITDLVMQDAIVYGGFSAGACVATPTLKGIDKCDNPNVQVDCYDPEIIWEGLNLVPYSIVPHFESDHPESNQMNEVIIELQQHSLPYRTLHDGEVIIVDE